MEKEKQINWSSEANAVIDDIKSYVSSICVAKDVESDCNRIHFNLTTLESEFLHVVLDRRGFSIQNKEGNPSDTYETIYALLNAKSNAFRDAFAQTLIDRLESLDSLT